MEVVQSLKDTSLVVHIIMMLFGMRAWVDLAGIWVELPILVERLPEGWTLGSYVSVILQIANVVLVLYTVLNQFFPGCITEKRVISGIYILGGVCNALLVFFWERTSEISGNEHSTALLVLTFILGGLACTTSVVFVTFVSGYKQSYLTSMFIGQGFSLLLPSVAAIVQGVGHVTCQNVSSSVQNNTGQSGNATLVQTYSIQPQIVPPLFEPSYFFVIIIGFDIVSFVAYLCLCFWSKCTKEKVEIRSVTKFRENSEHSITKYTFVLLMFIVFWVNGLWNGVLRSLQSYAALPFGNSVYHLAVTLAEVANPLTCTLALFIPIKSTTKLTSLAVVATGICGFMLTSACLSPNPPLSESTAGQVLAVLSQVLIAGLVSFIKVCVAGICHTQSRRAAMWFGILVQAGSLVGSIISFLCVNVFHLFRSADICSSSQVDLTM